MLHLLYLLSVGLHVLAAAVWIGGMAFLALVLVPVLGRGEHREQAAAFIGDTGLRFRPVGWICLGLLIATGATNLALRGVGLGELGSAAFWQSSFGRALALKLMLVSAIVALSALHDFFVGPRVMARWRQGADAQEVARGRRLAGAIGRANMALALLALALGICLSRGCPG